jgi:hypothetical protein
MAGEHQGDSALSFWVLGRSGYAMECWGGGGLGSAIMVWEGDLAWWNKNKMPRKGGSGPVWCIVWCAAG